MLRFITIRERNLCVTIKPLVPAVLGLIVFGTISPIWATVDFSAYLPIAGTPVTPSIKFTKTVQLLYPDGGKLKNELSGKSITIAFSDNSTNNTSIKSFMQAINTELATDRKTTATFTDLRVDYTVMISGNDQQASIDYLIKLTPTLTDYVLSKGDTSTPTVFDASWIGFTIKNPVSINTTNYGDLEINYPLDVIKSQLPNVYDILKGTQAESALSTNLIDASTLLNQPINTWDTLFDPSYVVTDSVALGYNGQKVAVTTLASGTSGVQAGSLTVKNIDMDFTGDAKYHLKTIERASSGTINVDGHASGYFVQNLPAISTTAQASSGNSTATAQGLSTMTIYAMAGFAAVIAGGVFFWSNRKMKQALNRVQEPSRPLEYETRQHWADRFDGQSSDNTNQPSKPDDKSKRSAI